VRTRRAPPQVAGTLRDYPSTEGGGGPHLRPPRGGRESWTECHSHPPALKDLDRSRQCRWGWHRAAVVVVQESVAMLLSLCCVCVVGVVCWLLPLLVLRVQKLPLVLRVQKLPLVLRVQKLPLVLSVQKLWLSRVQVLLLAACGLPNRLQPRPSFALYSPKAKNS